MDFDLHTDNGAARSICLNRSTVWVADSVDSNLFAYTLSGDRDPSKEFALASGNNNASFAI